MENICHISCQFIVGFFTLSSTLLFSIETSIEFIITHLCLDNFHILSCHSVTITSITISITVTAATTITVALEVAHAATTTTTAATAASTTTTNNNVATSVGSSSSSITISNT